MTLKAMSAASGSFLGAEAPVPAYSLQPDLGSPYLNIKSLLQNSSGRLVLLRSLLLE